MIDVREVRTALEFYNRAQSGDETSAIELAPIQMLESKVEQLILLVRDVSAILDDAEQLWVKGQIQPVVTAAATDTDLPANSSYPKGWWLSTIIPQILALKTHLSTENGGGLTPNEVFFAKPPKDTA